MKQEITIEKKIQSDKINQLAYILYMVLVLFQLVTEDYDWAVANLGIALAFDPFAAAKWQDRTMAQKTWLYIHLALLIAGISFLVFC